MILDRFFEYAFRLNPRVGGIASGLLESSLTSYHILTVLSAEAVMKNVTSELEGVFKICKSVMLPECYRKLRFMDIFSRLLISHTNMLLSLYIATTLFLYLSSTIPTTSAYSPLFADGFIFVSPERNYSKKEDKYSKNLYSFKLFFLIFLVFV